MKKLIILLNIICAVYCVSNPEQSDSRKNSINSLTSKHDGLVKVTQSSELSVQHVSPQIKYSNPTLAQPEEYANNVQPQSSIHSSEQSVTKLHQTSAAPILPTSLPPLLPTAPKKNLSYVITVKPNNGQHFYPSILHTGSTPVIMQYLPQNQPPTGGIQYFQLIPTRSLILPMSSYLTQPHAQSPQYQFLQQLQQLQPQKAQQNEFKPIINNNNNQLVIPSISPASSSSLWTSPTSSSPLSSSSLSSSSSSSSSPLTPSLLLSSTSLSPSIPSSPSSIQQPSIQSPSITNFVKSSSFIPYQNPIGGYSSPIISYLKSNGMQIVRGPNDLTLNTNEYIPIQSGDNNSYHVTRA